MSDRIKVGIWGLGRAGINMHAAELMQYPQMYEVCGGYDIDPEHNRIFTQKTGAKAYASEEALLNDPATDMITIATRSADHVAHCEKALATGKYVVLDKPIALTYADGLRLKALDSQYPGKLFLRHNRRFEAAFNRVREIIDSGLLGEVYEIKLCRHSYKRRSDWQTLIACGGGQLNNWGPHIIDHALQFLDYQVKETWSDLKRVAAVGDAEDHLKVVMKGESGRVVDLEISSGVALPQPAYTVFGTRGALTCHENRIHLKYIDPEQVFQQVEAHPGNPPLEGGISNAYADLEAVRWIEQDIEIEPSTPADITTIWAATYAAIKEGTPFPVTLEQGLAVLKISEEIKQRSAFALPEVHR